MEKMTTAIVSFIDRSTQDDNKSKICIGGLFSNPLIAEDLLPYYPNQDVKRYIIGTDIIERFEKYYNFIQDLVLKYGAESAIYHLDDMYFTADEENLFRSILELWNNIDVEHWKSFIKK